AGWRAKVLVSCESPSVARRTSPVYRLTATMAAAAGKGSSGVAISGTRGQRLTRRGFVRTVGAGMALSALASTLVAPITRAAPSAAVTPGVLVVGLVAEPTSLDPGQLTDINSMKLLGAMYDTLVRFKPDSFDLAPSLATSWDISSDLMLYTFKLRPGVKFHDGTDFNADAVKFTYDRLLDPNP